MATKALFKNGDIVRVKESILNILSANPEKNNFHIYEDDIASLIGPGMIADTIYWLEDSDLLSEYKVVAVAPWENLKNIRVVPLEEKVLCRTNWWFRQEIMEKAVMNIDMEIRILPIG